MAAALCLLTANAFCGSFRVATYNLEAYLDASSPGRTAKSPESKAKLHESILALQPDVLAIQEIGSPAALEELTSALRKAGWDFRDHEFVPGYDTNIHLAVLSRFPITRRNPHTNETYLLGRKIHHVSRGFAEVDIQVNSAYSFTLFAAHLKSKRVTPQADESEMRQEEARLLREKIEAFLARSPRANFVVAGDLNDTPDALSTRVVLGKGRSKLLDTRPFERNGDDAPDPKGSSQPRNVNWTHYFAREDSYARIDYLLVSPGMAPEWRPGGTRVLTIPNWGLASDHRPLVAEFEAEDR
jgi:endonuclease/exonuclease/phosphatase family metal-dependent hydrolase